MHYKAKAFFLHTSEDTSGRPSPEEISESLTMALSDLKRDPVATATAVPGDTAASSSAGPAGTGGTRLPARPAVRRRARPQKDDDFDVPLTPPEPPAGSSLLVQPPPLPPPLDPEQRFEHLSAPRISHRASRKRPMIDPLASDSEKEFQKQVDAAVAEVKAKKVQMSG